MVEKEVEMSSNGELNFKIPQQEWTGNDSDTKQLFCRSRNVHKQI